jgi:hypothetical protein
VDMDKRVDVGSTSQIAGIDLVAVVFFDEG